MKPECLLGQAVVQGTEALAALLFAFELVGSSQWLAISATLFQGVHAVVRGEGGEGS
jgi:hypothetical protein